MAATTADRPLVQRFPALGALPHAALCSLPTPVLSVALDGGRTLLVKRDDLSASPVGGNKARGLEWLLGAVARGDRIVTVGPGGSNHALATATYARQLGASTTVIRWRQHMNEAAVAVDGRMRAVARVRDVRWVAAAYAVAMAHRAAGARWIPAGGAAPLAILGHVNAALELVAQIAAGEAQRPSRVFVPLGTGGTAAGLALGFRLAGQSIPIVAVRVVPRIVGGARRVASLANRTAALIERHTGQFVPRLSRHDIGVEHAYFAGEYGRPLPGHAVDDVFRGAGLRLDDTYSRKAAAAAVDGTDRRPMLWLTFDGRVFRDDRATSR
ncbi:MAG TPA: pyridoxal-phosphate dependent enzyme [Gemmatimonadaceae bacterium]|nr:pyridoxal-phosphate dependent enzyme [Gemmatimonadaceae bacterium]